jgi:hypothetical protein
VQVTPAIEGVVLDATSHQPIFAAVIRLAELPENTTRTDSAGRFKLDAIRKWQVMLLGSDVRPVYTLEVEAPGYIINSRAWDTGNDRRQIVELQARERK